MKTAIGAIGTAIAASACCIGPVVFSLAGAGALGAASTKLEVYRPWFLAATVALLGVAFYGAYRPAVETCAPEDACLPGSKRLARIIVWMAAALVVLLVTFPYYIAYLL